MQEQAAEWLAQGRYDEAIALYHQCIEADPDTISHYWHLGLAWLLQGDAAEAQAIWLSVIMSGNSAQIESWTADLLRVLIAAAQQQINAGYLPQAIGIYRHLLEWDAENADIHYGLGHALAQYGELDGAIASWQQAIHLNPTLTPAYQHQAELWQHLEQFEQAIACYSRVVVDHPTNLKAVYNLGLCLARCNQLEEAIAQFRQAIQLQPGFAPAYGDWGITLLRQGRVSDAIPVLHHALSLIPAFVQTYVGWATRLAEQGPLNSTLYTNASLLEVVGHWDNVLLPETYLLLGKAFATAQGITGHLDTAIAIYHLALDHYPDATDISIELGKLLVQQRQLDQAITALDPCYIQPFLPVDTPTGFYESTWDWAVAHHLESSHYFSIYPQQIVPLNPPKTLDGTVDIRFRFGTGLELPASFVAVIADGSVWIDEWSNAVITPDQKLLGDVSPDFPILSPGHPDKHPSKHSIFNAKQLPPPHSIEGTVAVLSGLFNHAYFHWMVDVLPRIELLHHSGINVAEIDYFLVNYRLPFQQETLHQLGISPSRILETTEYPHINASQLVVPSFPASVAWMPTWACDFLQKTFLLEGAIATSEKIERLYISRRQTANRRVLNEEEVVHRLTQQGFKSVVLESLSVVEQAALLAHARVVVAPHGGGLTNIVFCQPGTTIIEFFSPNYVYPCYWYMSNLMGFEYYYLLGEIPAGFYLNKLLHPHARTEDMGINVDHLMQLLNQALLNAVMKS